MFRLIKWAFYGIIGYGIYQSFWGDWFEERDSRSGRRSRGSRRSSGQSADAGGTRPIEAKKETVQERSGAQHSQTVGRGVLT